MRTERRIKGYTLIEVLVAMTILAMACTVLMRLFSGGLRGMAISADYAHAVLLAESQLATAGSSEAIAPGESEGVDDKFRWTRTVERYVPKNLSDTDELPVAAYRVTVVVEWPNSIGSRRLNLSTIKLDRSQGTGHET